MKSFDSEMLSGADAFANLNIPVLISRRTEPIFMVSVFFLFGASADRGLGFLVLIME